MQGVRLVSTPARNSDGIAVSGELRSGTRRGAEGVRKRYSETDVERLDRVAGRAELYPFRNRAPANPGMGAARPRSRLYLPARRAPEAARATNTNHYHPTMSNSPRSFARPLRGVGLLAFLALVGATPARAQQATTTGTVRGVVQSAEGPVAEVTVTATNQASGVRRGLRTDAAGRYQIPFLDPGSYTVRAQRIGFRPAEVTGVRIALGAVQVIDISLEVATAQLQSVQVTANAEPLIENGKTGTSTRILEEQIRNLPTSDRNFKNLVVLTPGTSDVGATGAGGGQSIGGGRTASSNLLMDGVNNNESYFGGDARGGDRLPFSYSIEAVKEIQVITAGYDVERGQFTGGTVNAVTKSGTNQFAGSVFDYERGDKRFGVKLTGQDFLGRDPRSYLRRQYGGSFGGPIIKDKLHFFFTLDRQVGNEPKPVLQTGTGADAIRAAGIGPDTLARLLAVAKNVYGYDLASEIGSLKQNIDESAVFGRLDWQINERHSLTLRDNYLNFRQTQDRLTISPSTNETSSNAGPYKERTNSAVVALTSSLTNQLSNELRAQYATDRKPRPAGPTAFGGPLPQVQINNVTSPIGDGSNAATTIFFGSDPVLHANNLEQNTTEVIDNVRYTLDAHTLKVGGNFTKVHVFNKFFFNSLGSYTFNSLGEFASNSPARFTRALPFVPGGASPDALFDVYEYAGYAQDDWQATRKLFVTYGLRLDGSRFPTTPTRNALLDSTSLGVHTDFQPSGKVYVSPRFGFTFDPLADGRQVLRGGTGLFYGRSPYVLYGNTLSNTGLTQRDLDCRTTQVPAIDFTKFAAGTIPETCAGGAQAAVSKASPVVFSPDFRQTRAWKSNLAVDRLITPSLRATIEGVYTRITDDYTVRDANLNATQQFTIEGGIPVFVPATTIAAAGTSGGATNIANSRRDTRFNNVFVQESQGGARSIQGIAQLRGSSARGQLTASYTYDRTRDYNSASCCIAGGDLFGSTRTFGSPNELSGQYGAASYNRKHSIVLSPTINLPYGFALSGIFRSYSGLPYTPRYRGDVNGDGVTNDRLYVPTEAELASYQFLGSDSVATVQRTAFGNKIASTACLRDNRGRVIGRNECRNPWQNILDARVAKTFRTFRGQGVEISADFFNLLNGLSSKWGQRNEVQAANEQALQPRGFNPVTKRYIYQYNTNFGKQEPSAFGISQQFQVQLGARYAF
jgi:outer membrane receptor protein involved in Fe transport